MANRNVSRCAAAFVSSAVLLIFSTSNVIGQDNAPFCSVPKINKETQACGNGLVQTLVTATNDCDCDADVTINKTGGGIVLLHVPKHGSSAPQQLGLCGPNIATYEGQPTVRYTCPPTDKKSEQKQPPTKKLVQPPASSQSKAPEEKSELEKAREGSPDR
jgi:hypothetical protein